MSSRRASLLKRANLASSGTALGKTTAIASGVPSKKRGPRQPQPADFQVTLDLPQSVPILDKELRAIEILLGSELQDLLTNSGKER